MHHWLWRCHPPPPLPAALPPLPPLQCLQYKTDQQSDLRKLEKLNLQMMALMATGEAPTGGGLLLLPPVRCSGVCGPARYSRRRPQLEALAGRLHCWTCS